MRADEKINAHEIETCVICLDELRCVCVKVAIIRPQGRSRSFLGGLLRSSVDDARHRHQQTGAEWYIAEIFVNCTNIFL